MAFVSIPPFLAREPAAPVDPAFVDRWSPRAFAPDPVTRAELAILFEAARWAPSAFNEQPWLFLYAADETHLPRYRELLIPSNRVWADHAPVLAILFARRTLARDGRPNRWATFDCGAAWLSVALQARRLGLFAHAMAGFDQRRAHEVLGVPADRYEAMVAIAIGHHGDAAQLPEPLRARELPNGRHPSAEWAVEGVLPPEFVRPLVVPVIPAA
jgi:nitroreductase